jgi:hypothetical protein
MTVMLNKLRKHAATPVELLTPEIRNDLENFSELAGLLSETGFYSDLVRVMNSIFGDLTSVKPDTVGAFFHGCFQSSNYPGLQACSAVCAGMMPAPKVVGSVGCQDNVIFFDGETLKHQHEAEVKTERAIIHVTAPSKYQGFTPTHIKQLQESGIKTVTLYLVDENERYTEKLNSQPLSSLPIRQPRTISSSGPAAAAHPPRHPDRNKDSGSSAWIWVIVFIGIILLIGLLFWVARRRNGSSSTTWSAPASSWLTSSFKM